ncbi:MAG: glycosyltransferase [Candidatus Omnitrophica bacterium]|nr:glycosyltransferase [Candidatus Omnitrophota bacterium]
MEKVPEISVVIAAYNHGKYIEETVRSVLKQTFADLEVIVFDDGSKDDTREIIAGIDDKRVKYFYQENSGLPACGRNRGMSLARGKYIALLDGDDTWREDKLARCREILDENPGVDLVFHNEAVVYNGKVLRHTSFGPLADNMYNKLLFKGNCMHSSAVVLRRKIVFDDGMKYSEDKELFTIEDYDYWMRLSQRYRFHFLPDSLAFYRVTETGAFLRSAESNAVNTLKLLDRNFARIDRSQDGIDAMVRKRRASVMIAGGRMHHHNRDFRASRRWYLRAIKEDPMNYKAYVSLAAALLRYRIVYR